MQVPDEIGSYRIVSILGRGGMSEVYSAQTSGGELVALKVLSFATVQKVPQFLGRFQREARSLMALSHPHIVAIHDAGESHGFYYIAMELLEGETLKARLARGPLSFDELTRLISQTATAISFCHARGILHRDIKPANVFLDRGGGAKILDFSLSKSHTDQPLTSVGRRIGTPRYLAPEAVRGEPPREPGDLYQLGLVYYEAMCGEPAFPDTDIMTVFRRVLSNDPILVRKRVPEAPIGLSILVENCLLKDPARRYQRADEILDDLVLVEVGRVPASRS